MQPWAAKSAASGDMIGIEARTMRNECEPGNVSFDETGNRQRVARLRNAGVLVSSPERVFVGPEVRLDCIESDAVLMNAVVLGEQTTVGSQARVGVSGTAVLVNTQVGRAVELGAGSYRQATLLAGAKVRGFAELRPGTVLEESAEAGHNVGLKHAFFTTGVVAGSGINFCDVLVTGGSSRQDHTEIGSGTVHFNFDPHCDKFGSLFGDATGLLLRQPRIFIGGNCGIVAPVHVAFGAVVAAGTTLRRSVDAHRLYVGEPADSQTGDRQFDPEIYHDLRRKFLNTALLAGNLQAFEVWYRVVRLPCAEGLERNLCEGALRHLRLHLEHRASELDKLLSKLVRGRKTGRKNAFATQQAMLVKNRRSILELLTRTKHVSPPAGFVRRYASARRSLEHPDAIREMPQKIALEAERWLADMASRPSAELGRLLR